MLWADEKMCTGEFKDRLRDGLGTMYYNGDSMWMGDWTKDKRNGQGTEYSPRVKILREGNGGK